MADMNAESRLRLARRSFRLGTDGHWYWGQSYGADKWWESMGPDTVSTTLEVARTLKLELRIGWPAVLEIIRLLALAPVSPATLIPPAESAGTPVTGVPGERDSIPR